MSDSQVALVRYRLRRAEETLQEAELMADNKHWNACVNRLYYAAFYAVIAFLAMRNISAKTHSGVLRMFGQHLVKTNLISQEVGKLYYHLYETRQEGDYSDFVQMDAAVVAGWIPRTHDFVDSIEKIINAELAA